MFMLAYKSSFVWTNLKAQRLFPKVKYSEVNVHTMQSRRVYTVIVISKLLKLHSKAKRRAQLIC